MSLLYSIACSYYRYGLSILPLVKGGKRPHYRLLPSQPDPSHPRGMRRVWTPLQATPPTPLQLDSWFAEGDGSIGIICGAVSGGLVVFDFDHDARRTYRRWRAEVGSLADRLPIVATAKGAHVYVRFRRRIGNQVLAADRQGHVLIETRGEGGYVVAPPSHHSTGVPYRWCRGDHRQIIFLSPAEEALLLRAARRLNRFVRPRRRKLPAYHRPRPLACRDQKRLRAYAARALTNEAAQLARTTVGNRNNTLYRAAAALGRFLDSELLASTTVEAALLTACQRNQLMADDGERACWATLQRGMEAGRQSAIQPVNLLQQLYARTARV